MNEKNEPRIRLNVKTTAKGECQLDVTIESYGFEESVETRAMHIVRQLNEFKRLLKSQGYTIAGEVKK